jgi:hypothetical protein
MKNKANDSFNARPVKEPEYLSQNAIVQLRL